jgi:hypothetical protein
VLNCLIAFLEEASEKPVTYQGFCILKCDKVEYPNLSLTELKYIDFKLPNFLLAPRARKRSTRRPRAVKLLSGKVE